MANWYYYDQTGKKCGPVDSKTLKTLAQNGIITDNSVIETETGKSAKAKNVKGLEFLSRTVPVPPVYSGSPNEPPKPQETSTPPPTVTNPWAALDQENQEQQPQVSLDSFDNMISEALTQEIQDQQTTTVSLNGIGSRLIVSLNGIGSRLIVYDNKIRIVRSGVGSFILHGLKGDKTLYYHQITSLQIKKGNMLTNGYLQFSIQGGKESTGGILAATQDENTIIFNYKQNDQAQRIHDLIENKLLESQMPKQTPISTQISVTDEIVKMKNLLDNGLISQEEFNAFKKKMLGI
jgi:hypothetical protein